MKTIKLRDGKIQIFQVAASPFWQVRFSLPEHGQIKKSLQTGDEDEARGKALNLYDEMRFNADNDKPLESRTFEQISAEVLANMEAELARGEIRRHKLDDYRGVIHRYLNGYFGKMRLDRIKDRDIERYKLWRRDYWIGGPGSKLDAIEYVRQTKRGPKTVKRKIRQKAPSASREGGELVMLRQVLRYAAKMGYCDKSIVIAVESPRPSNRRKPDFSAPQLAMLLTESEKRIAAVHNHASYKRDRGMLHAFMEVMLATGMRPLEAYQLQWRDVDGFKPGGKLAILDTVHPVRIRVRGKGKHRTLVPLSGVIIWLEFLWDLCVTETGKPPAGERFVFTHPDGAPIKTFKKALRSLLIDTGLLVGEQGMERNGYSFRHTYVTQQIIAGVDHYVLAKNCGTSPAMIEKHYGHVEPQMVARALMPRWGIAPE